MLKEEYDTLMQKIHNWMLGKYMKFMTDRMYGATAMSDINGFVSLMEIELLEFVQRANLRRNPKNMLRLPACICQDDFNHIVSIVKNKLL
jgi:hypothetical protein